MSPQWTSAGPLVVQAERPDPVSTVLIWANFYVRTLEQEGILSQMIGALRLLISPAFLALLAGVASGGGH